MAKKKADGKIEEGQKREWIDDFKDVMNQIDELKPSNKIRGMLVEAIDIVKKKYVKITKELNKGGK
jgi:hypothetical protein